jgi:hypothetical protein
VDLAGRSRSYCHSLDPVCQGGLALELVPAHLRYRNWATQAATDFVTSIEPPAICPISTATWRKGEGVISPSSGVVMTDVFGGEEFSARAAPGYRFVGFVAVANVYVGDGTTTAVMRVDQPSFLTSDSPYQDQNVVAVDAGVQYAQARVVPANCGRSNGQLMFAIAAAQDRHIKVSGKLTFGGRPYAGAMVVWQALSTSDPDSGFAFGSTDFNNRTQANGSWRFEARGPVKPVISAGIYLMRLAFAGDVNHMETLSRTQRVVVRQAPTR